MTDASDLAERIATLAGERGLTIGTAESLTGGLVASRLSAAQDASSWYRGGVVAYARDVKYNLLDVPEGPVVSETAARQMAEAAARLLEADVTVSVTGVGGPDEQDGQPPGTVWVGLHSNAGTNATELSLSGDPSGICRDATTECLRLLHDACVAHAQSS